MIEEWQKEFYLLGLLSSLFFGIRFFLQWWISERKGTSVVTKSFWHLSILANLSLAFHGVLQLQMPIAILQGVQAVLAKRNLELLREKKPPLSRLWIPTILILGTIMGAFIFLSMEMGEWVWMRTPRTPWSEGDFETPLLLEILGLLGLFLFSSRFLVQWWEAEKVGHSFLSPTFWFLSLAGALLSSLYFWYILDFINLMGPLFTSLGAARNLFLYRKE